MAIPPGYATAVWPPSGIALAALLIGGGRLWPGIWVGSFTANLAIDGAVFASLVIATGSTLQALVVGALARRHVGALARFESVDQVVRFVLISALGSTIAPTFAWAFGRYETPWRSTLSASTKV